MTGRNRRPQSPDCIKAPPQNHSPLNRGLISFLSCCKQVAEKRKVRWREKEGRVIMYSCLIIGISSKSGAKDRHLCGYKEEIIYI